MSAGGRGPGVGMIRFRRLYATPVSPWSISCSVRSQWALDLIGTSSAVMDLCLRQTSQQTSESECDPLHIVLWGTADSPRPHRSTLESFN